MVDLYIEIIKIGIVGLYIVWGFAFSIHSLLILHNNKSAIEWARRFHTPKMFRIEAYIFFPMIYLCWILFEFLPALLKISSDVIEFNLERIITTPFKKR